MKRTFFLIISSDFFDPIFIVLSLIPPSAAKVTMLFSVGLATSPILSLTSIVMFLLVPDLSVKVKTVLELSEFRLDDTSTIADLKSSDIDD